MIKLFSYWDMICALDFWAPWQLKAKKKVSLLSRGVCSAALVVSDSLQPYGLYSPPGSSVHGIFQQECWSGLPFPSPGDLPDPGTEPASSARLLHWQAGSLLLGHQGNPLSHWVKTKSINSALTATPCRPWHHQKFLTSRITKYQTLWSQLPILETYFLRSSQYSSWQPGPRSHRRFRPTDLCLALPFI